jgi:hypothetical protein
MTGIDTATQLDLHPDGGPTTLKVLGDVGPVLLGTCAWAPQAPDEQPGAIRAVDMSRDGLSFGLGSAAFGQPPEHAVRELGEYVLVDRYSWWTPAVQRTTSRLEAAKTPALTPFMILWDRMATAAATLRMATPVPVVQWYEHLMRALTALGACRTGTMTVELIADLPASHIVDKRLRRAPLRQYRPQDGRLITDGTNLDTFFLRDAASGAHGADDWCTVVMEGLVVDPAVAQATWGAEFVRRGFYRTPGVIASATVIHHTHALVAARLPAPDPPTPAGAVARQRFESVATELSTGSHAVLATHIENDTLIHEAVARIGVVGHLELA